MKETIIVGYHQPPAASLSQFWPTLAFLSPSTFLTYPGSFNIDISLVKGLAYPWKKITRFSKLRINSWFSNSHVVKGMSLLHGRSFEAHMVFETKWEIDGMGVHIRDASGRQPRV